MAQKRELFINAVRQVSINGSTTVPTVVRYQGGKALVGSDALNECHNPSELREDFKVEIGSEDPLKLARRPSALSQTPERSILGIAKDFTDHIVGAALEKITSEGFVKPTKILVAEPLALARSAISHDNWLQNYRKSLSSILAGKFTEVDFMPEPFAVFQYYRYGVRHALVAQKQQNVALVIDFGGGTFDTCIIETTKTGDISQSGRNARPLAARSIPMGGHAINRLLADILLFQGIEKGHDRTQLGNAIKAYQRLKNADDSLLSGDKYADFVRNYHRLLQSVEQAKCLVCGSIPSWKLDADISTAACSVEVPTAPLSPRSPISHRRLDGTLLRKVYEDDVWKKHLLPAIKETIGLAQAELGNKPITVVLLSGGSSNLKWLKPLLERDVEAALREAEVLELGENFQEIVAKGLAIECARRFYTEGDGDFRAVTYNRLCLGLDPNGQGLEFKKYIPEDKDARTSDLDDGVLIPSATLLSKAIDRPMRWKVRPTNLPSQVLNYYFMRSSFDIEDVKARQNLDVRLPTPSGVKMGRTVGVELLVREDGTAEPAFLYGHGDRDGRTTSVKGRPFYLDMTFATENTPGNSYIGLDFGTSTSSISYVNEVDIQTYKARSSDRTWLSLSALVSSLPYPAAYPLARLISASTPEQITRASREAFEGMLTLATYTAYAEHCTVSGGRSSSFFKGLRQCSAGPLWRTLKDMIAATGRRWVFCQEMLGLVSGSFLDEMDRAVSQVALDKHNKKGEGVDWPRTIEQLGNVLAKIFEGRLFGYFEDARRKPFRRDTFVGVFRNALGVSSAFNEIYSFEGPDDFAQEFVFVFDPNAKYGLRLSPLFVRGLEPAGTRRDDPDFFLFDIIKGQNFEFKAVQEREPVLVTDSDAFKEMHAEVSALLSRDPKTDQVIGFEFSAREFL